MQRQSLFVPPKLMTSGTVKNNTTRRLKNVKIRRGQMLTRELDACTQMLY